MGERRPGASGFLSGETEKMASLHGVRKMCKYFRNPGVRFSALGIIWNFSELSVCNSVVYLRRRSEEEGRQEGKPGS